jgi:predicted NACHT family NTPase
MSDSRILSVKPIIHYPRVAQVGKTYLMTIDLEMEEEFDWQYEEEEYPIYCTVDSDLFGTKPFGEPVVVLHRFGGSYGEAKFSLSAASIASEGNIRVTLINRWGVSIKALCLGNINLISSAIDTSKPFNEYDEVHSTDQILPRNIRSLELPERSLLNASNSIDFQPYLESVRATYANWWQLYTLTDAVGEQRQSKYVSPTFDFALMVQTVTTEERDPEGKEKGERLPVIEGLCKYSDQHVLLVGPPGSGKSTALARLLLEEVETALASNSLMKLEGENLGRQRIPVLVELRYWQGSIARLILNSLARHGLPLMAEQLEIVLSRSLLLFDGVNELSSEAARLQLVTFRRDHPKLPMIFTTRDLSLGGDLGIEQKLEMQPLTEPQMQAFVRAYVPEQARLREFGQTPLLLWMLCGLFQQTGTMPENLGLAFRLFTQSYERNLKQDVIIESDRAWWQPVLRHLAWVMMQGNQPMEFRLTIARQEAMGTIAQFLTGKVPHAVNFARECLQDLQKHHLIQAGTNPEELEFCHQLIQEYYAAEALLGQLSDLSDAELQREYLNYLKWTEPMALMLGLAGEEQAVRVVQLALDVDCLLGARLAGEVKREFQSRTVGFVDRLEVPDWLKFQLLENTRSDGAIPGLLNFVEDTDAIVRQRAAVALSQISSEIAIPGLLKLLEDTDATVRTNAAEVLGKIGSETAIPVLLKLVEDSDVTMRQSAAVALSNLAKHHSNIMAQYLSHLLTLIPTYSGKEAFFAFTVIQSNCKFYNYQIYHSTLSRSSDQGKIINIKANIQQP